MQRMHDRTLHRWRIVVDEGRLQAELVQICRHGLSVSRYALDEIRSMTRIMKKISASGLSIGTAFVGLLGTLCILIALL